MPYRCRQVLLKKFAKLFHQYRFLFLRILFIQPVLNSNFSTKFFTIFLIVLDLLVSVNVLVIKITTLNLADVWHIIFSLILLKFYRVKGLVLAIKVQSYLSFLHNLCIKFFVIKYCILLKLVYQNKNELLGTSMTFKMSFQV